MSSPSLGPQAWSRALSLSERAAIDVLIPGPIASPEGSPEAEFRLRAWRSQSPLDQDAWLRTRLALEGLTREGFAALLRRPAESFAAGLEAPPSWVRALDEAYASGPGPIPRGAPSSSAVADPAAGFLRILHPLIERAEERLRERIEPIASRPAGFEAETAMAGLRRALHSRLLQILDRTLVLELNVLRVQGELPGESPEDRFRAFVDRISTREGALRILREYPVMARLAVEETDRWVVTSAELLERLQADAGILRARLFQGEDSGAPAEIELGAGDPHRGGRSVAIVRFVSGRRAVYKPRPLAIDVRFQALLRWLDERGSHPPFKKLTVLDRGTYGWMEFAERSPCSSMEEIRRYHRRLGGLLAIFYVLEATDVHYENLIACGDHPVPIDLESILHPRPPRAEPERPDELLAGRALSGSVLRVGLLPFRVGESDDFEGIDLSGVASVEGQATPEPVLHWERAGTDEMRAARRRMTMTGGGNRPVLDGREADISDHIDDVAAGFESLYQLLARHREVLLREDGPLGDLDGVEVRAVLRPTRAYGLLLEESFHPDFLRDALDRDLFLDRLWAGVDEQPAYGRVVPHEGYDLRSGDIPYFSARPTRTDAWSSGGRRIDSLFAAAPVDLARARLAGLGAEDLERQTWLIRTSLATRLLDRSRQGWSSYAPIEASPAGDAAARRTRLLAAAGEIGAWLERMAIRDGDHVTWITLDVRGSRWSLIPLSEDLYAGAPGIALFLAHLADLDGDRRHEATARAAVRTLLARLSHTADAVTNIGAFQGWGGIVYTLAHLGALWEDRDLLRAAEAMTDRIERHAGADSDLDVVAGAAGAIEGLLALGAASGSGRAIDAALRCGERLLGAARPSGSGLAWHTRIGPDEPQTGFSHGAAGIGLALIDLAAACSDERFRAAALAGFERERELLWPRIRSWTSEEEVDSASGDAAHAEKMVTMAWCYGAPGVGLSRLRALRHVDDASAREEVAEAVRLTVERGFGKNHCLCHGDLGNLDLLLQASRAPGREDLAAHVSRLTDVVLGSIARDGWRCGTPAGVTAPGLMNGLAGIGLGLLRLASADRVPSVLILEPPPARDRDSRPSGPA